MSQRRKLRHLLQQLSETRGIIEAMKNLAVVEIHKLDRRLENQQQMVQDLEQMAADLLGFHPYTLARDGGHRDIWLLFGSERGFCGDFNESIIDNLLKQLTAQNGPPVLIPIGSKLCQRLDGDPRVTRFIEGADVTEEVTRILNTIIQHINDLQTRYGNCYVFTLYHHAETGQLTCSQLLPPFKQLPATGQRYGTPPVLNIAPDILFQALMDHYLFTALHEIAYMSLMAENYSRIQHMTGALHRLDERVDDVMRKYHIRRQEEITEEIEVILLNATNISQL
jgi:F-type H+-transporting ATPase subunit gamma